MAETNRGNRPLSPHLTVYRWEQNMVMSIGHRVTGAGLLLTAILVVWWFAAAAGSPAQFARADGLLTSWIGGLVMILSLAAFWYHAFTGIRHLIWDTGAWYDLDTVYRSGIGVLVAAGLMTVITLIVAFV